MRSLLRYRAIVPPVTTIALLMLTSSCSSDSPQRLTAPSAVMAVNVSEWSQPVNLGPNINSPFIEQQPTLTKDGLTLYFTSGRATSATDTDFDQNIWVAQRACRDDADPACGWGQPMVLGPEINGPYFDVSPALSRDEHYLFFASQRARANCVTEPCDRDVWVSYRENAKDNLGWLPPVNLGPGVNGPGEDLAPSYFENEGGAPTLFFTRGLLNAADLYVSGLQPDGSWGPASAISELNSTNGDARPSNTADGLEIYYWSSRPACVGCASGIQQIWHSTRESVTAPWSVPTLVPSPISDAPSQQPFIYRHGNTESLYFNRTTTPGNTDLWVSHRTRGGP